jgi:hypothetical protein
MTGLSTRREMNRIAATMIDGMKPEYIGRVLGTGVRVAGRVAAQRMASGSSAPAGEPQVQAGTRVQSGQVTEAVRQGTEAVERAARSAAQTSRGVAKGLRGFVTPFRRAGGILWLQVTGAFFLLPALVFAPTVWRTRASWAAGPDHKTFLASAIVVTLFLYFGVSSFWRAGRRAKRTA